MRWFFSRGQPAPGFKQWELRRGERVLVCEFRDTERRAATIDVQLLEDGKLILSMRCITSDSARYVAELFRQDHLLRGWTAIDGPAPKVTENDATGD